MTRHEEARLDAYIAATEHGETDSRLYDVPLPSVWALQHTRLEESGLLDPEQPTRWSTYDYNRRMSAEFSPEERHQIRYLLAIQQAKKETEE